MEMIRSERISWRQIYLLLCPLLICSLVRQSLALSLTVNDEECVTQFVLYEADTVSGNFVVLDNGLFWGSDYTGINFTITGPRNHVIHTLKDSSGDKFEFRAPVSGMYKFCFHNPSSAPETVSFHIHVGHIPNGNDVAKDEHLDPINVKIAELREALEDVASEQKYLKARDVRHRHTSESTRKRVVAYTVLEYLLLVAASGVQVLIIHRLFSKSVGYNRI